MATAALQNGKLVWVEQEGKKTWWEPTTELICSFCREALSPIRATLGKVNFTYDWGMPNPLESGEYWYLHKQCAFIDRVLPRRWPWLSLDAVLGLGFSGRPRKSRTQKELRQLMPPGVYDRLYVQWLPAISGKRTPQRRLTTSIAFICAHCQKPLSPEEYAGLHLAWPGDQSSFIGPHVLVHDACMPAYKKQHARLKDETLLRLFDINIHSYRDWILPEIADPLLAFFKPKRPPLRLKFGKDVWVGDSNCLVLVEREETKKKPIVEAPLRAERTRPQPRLKPEPKPRPVKPPKPPKPAPAGKPGHVYLIEAVGSERIKIGHGASAKVRLTQLGTGTPFPLKLLHSIPAKDSHALEQALHARYEAYKVWKEWYILPADVLAALLQEDFA